MKLFLSTDFEGTSGIVAWEQIIEGNPEYEQGRRLLTDEVNAVIKGALDAGANELEQKAGCASPEHLLQSALE